LKRLTIIVISFLIVLCLEGLGLCANRLLSYGFEDWSGDADSTPAYIFGTTAVTYWANHENITHVLSNCKGTAYEGTYFLRRQFYKANDSCLGTRPDANESRMNLGLGAVAYGNNADFDISKIKTGKFFIRMRFRNNGWANESVGYGAKFLRLYDADYSGKAYLHLRPKSDGSTSAWYYLYDQTSANFGPAYSHDTLLDGQWHSVCFFVEDNGNGTLKISVWWDDWNASGPPSASRVVTPISWGLPFSHCQVVANLSGADGKVVDDMSTDFDNIEVWDDMPSATPTSGPNPPIGLTVVE
jgi:hypothetical protein